MKWKRSLAHLLARHLSPEELVIIASEIAPEILSRLPRGERVAFGREMAEVIAEAALRDLGREERAQLMNALLPLLVREFPLADLDLLAAFPAPASPEHATEG